MKYIKQFEHFEERKESTDDDNLILKISIDIDKYGVDIISSDISNTSFKIKGGDLENSEIKIGKYTFGRLYIKKDNKTLIYKYKYSLIEHILNKIKEKTPKQIEDYKPKKRLFSIFHDE